jgi:hypothetical protein
MSASNNHVIVLVEVITSIRRRESDPSHENRKAHHSSCSTRWCLTMGIEHWALSIHHFECVAFLWTFRRKSDSCFRDISHWLMSQFPKWRRFIKLRTFSWIVKPSCPRNCISPYVPSSLFVLSNQSSQSATQSTFGYCRLSLKWHISVFDVNIPLMGRFCYKDLRVLWSTYFSMSLQEIGSDYLSPQRAGGGSSMFHSLFSITYFHSA